MLCVKVTSDGGGVCECVCWRGWGRGVRGLGERRFSGMDLGFDFINS